MMNVIRMIKLFGWEPRIAGQLNAKREEELAAVRRNRMLGLSNKICKCVLPCVPFFAPLFLVLLVRGC